VQGQVPAAVAGQPGGHVDEVRSDGCAAALAWPRPAQSPAPAPPATPDSDHRTTPRSSEDRVTIALARCPLSPERRASATHIVPVQRAPFASARPRSSSFTLRIEAKTGRLEPRRTARRAVLQDRCRWVTTPATVDSQTAACMTLSRPSMRALRLRRTRLRAGQGTCRIRASSTARRSSGSDVTTCRLRCRAQTATDTSTTSA
jgi:hypothetical protein